MGDGEHIKSPIRIASMFAGIGGICLAFKQVGCSIIWANEIDEAACRTYRHNFGGDYLIPGDIRNIAASSVPDCDILTAGFPCQSFSIGGAQRGFNDRRGELFFEVARVLREKRPAIVFLENVENLLEHDEGRTLQVVYAELAQLGYAVRYLTAPSNKYGNLPQPRKRVYLVAFQDWELCQTFQFPEPIPLTKTIFDVINLHDKKKEIYYYPAGDQFTEYLARQITDSRYIYRVFSGKVTKLRNGLSPTLTASMSTKRDAAALRDDYGIRRLTIRECLDLQGFPQDYSFPNTTTLENAYRQIGNSVSVPVVRRIAENIVKVLK